MLQVSMPSSHAQAHSASGVNAEAQAVAFPATMAFLRRTLGLEKEQLERVSADVR
jgi:hypothetical protein